MNNACRVHYFSYFVPWPTTATPSHTGHISLPQILYINASTLRDEYRWILHQIYSAVVDCISRVNFIIDDCTISRVKENCGYTAHNREKDEHLQQFKDVLVSLLGVVCCSFAIFVLHQQRYSRKRKTAPWCNGKDKQLSRKATLIQDVLLFEVFQRTLPNPFLFSFTST